MDKRGRLGDTYRRYMSPFVVSPLFVAGVVEDGRAGT
jgi:hypothetical protein